jgi:hypothetical protein
MSREGVQRLVELWRDDCEFRAALRRDPDSAVARAGIELDETELGALRATDWSESDEALQTRMASVLGISGPPA